MGTEKTSLLQPDMVHLLQDAVLSLCQSKYSKVSSLEVDAIICISLQDTVEQQVVKIHQTVNSDLNENGDAIFTSENDIRSRAIPVHTHNVQADSESKSTGTVPAKECESNERDKGVSNRKRRRKQATTTRNTDGLPSARSLLQEASLEMTVDSVTPENDGRSVTEELQLKEPDSLLPDVKTECDDTEYYSSALQPKIVSVVGDIQRFPDSGSQGEGQVTKQNLNYDNSQPEDSNIPTETVVFPNMSVQVKQEPDDWDYQSTQISHSTQQEARLMDHDTSNWSSKYESASPSPEPDNDLDMGSPDIDDDSDRDFEIADSEKYPPAEEEDITGVLKKRRCFKKQNSGKVKNWLEHVQSNVSRYHAAYVSKMAKKKMEDAKRRPGIVHGNVEKVLTKPKEQNEADGKADPVSQSESGIGLPAESIKKVHSSQSSSQSASPSPTPTADNTVTNKGTNQQSGKLESRYPALFSQLQKAKEVVPRASSSDSSQQDSLVNRLPFISFQELFSQANPCSPPVNNDKLPQTDFQPEKTTRRRLPKPKSSKGSRIKPVARTETKSKTFEDTDGDDGEWRPGQSDSPVSRLSGSRRVKTRLSSGKKKRPNFAELEDDDTEEDLVNDMVEQSVSTNIHFILCKNNCGAKFPSVESESLRLHENLCKKTEYTCSLCGLQFNQEYRWKFHMTKVHKLKYEIEDDLISPQLLNS